MNLTGIVNGSIRTCDFRRGIIKKLETESSPTSSSQPRHCILRVVWSQIENRVASKKSVCDTMTYTGQQMIRHDYRCCQRDGEVKSQRRKFRRAEQRIRTREAADEEENHATRVWHVDRYRCQSKDQEHISYSILTFWLIMCQEGCICIGYLPVCQVKKRWIRKGQHTFCDWAFPPGTKRQMTVAASNHLLASSKLQELDLRLLVIITATRRVELTEDTPFRCCKP